MPIDVEHLLGILIIDIGVIGTAILYILRHPSDPRGMAAWILTFLFLPILGVLLYLLIGEPKLYRVRRRRHRRRAKVGALREERKGSLQQPYALRADPVLPPPLDDFVRLTSRIGFDPPTSGNRVEVHQDGAAAFASLLGAVEAAQHHIHLEYYIFSADAAGQQLMERLVAKARQGVEVRLLMDFIGSLGSLRWAYRTLTQAGGEVAFFLPMIPWKGRWRMNFRNHRKILVIDGLLGYTGSQNIGNEYAGIGLEGRLWLDTQLRIEGPAVLELQEIFLEDWHYAGGHDPGSQPYFPAPRAEGDAIAQIIPSGPDTDAKVLHHLLLAAISVARRSIHIATPYFVPDAAMLLTLEAAAYRGVDVRLVVPEQVDHRIVLWAARSYFAELAAAGVKIYEYQRGMLHSKVVVVDSAWGLVGSANMDVRSFRINFEATVLLYDAPLAAELDAGFATTVQGSQRIRPSAAGQGFLSTLAMGVGRLFSPLL
jgi:cardiolipin synthase A/B